jgi:prepilin peptidase CpaA
METLLALAIILALLAAAWRDLAVRRLPNRLAAVIAAAGLGIRALEGPFAVGSSLVAAGALFAVLFLLFARGWLGGGDVKLATAVAIGLPPLSVWHFVVATALAGGALSSLYLVATRLPPLRLPPGGRTRGLLRRIAAAEAWRVRRRGPLPYGIALCASGVALTATSHLWG